MAASGPRRSRRARRRAWISPQARVEEGVIVEGPCFIDAGVVVKSRRTHRSVHRHRPPMLDRRARGPRPRDCLAQQPHQPGSGRPRLDPGPPLPRRPQRPRSRTASCSATSPSSPTTAAYKHDHSDRSVIFKAYDVRGLYPQEVNEDVARAIGRAFVSYLKAKRIAVGRDMRLSSPSLAAAFIDGATLQGADVVDYGMIPTDMLYFAVARDRHDGGVEITASHNPEAVQRHEDGAAGSVSAERRRRHLRHPRRDRRGRIAASGRRGAARSPRRICSTRTSSTSCRSSTRASSAPSTSCSMPAAAWAGSSRRSCSNASPAGPRVSASRSTDAFRITRPIRSSRRIGATSWNASSPRRPTSASPGTATPIAASSSTATGEFISGDFITALLAEAFLLKSPGATIIYDLRASHAVKDIVARHGGTSLMNRVGHAFFKRRMRETNAIFGGEVTGHYYFRDNFYADNGFIPALLILELMSKKGQSLHQLLEPLRRQYFISGEINTKLASMDLVPAKLNGDRGEIRGWPSVRAGRDFRGVSGLALQRAAVEHRAAAAAESRSEDAGADGPETRRGDRAHSRVINWRVRNVRSVRLQPDRPCGLSTMVVQRLPKPRTRVRSP